MNTYVYDGSFEGFLCVVFAAYQRDDLPASIEVEHAEQPLLFGSIVEVETDSERAVRVRSGLTRRLGSEAMSRLYRVFLSEQPSVEITLLRLIQACFERGGGVLTDFRFGPAWRVERLAQKVGREVHRMHAFVRFERCEGERYVAEVGPDFNVLPLIGEHFAQRYPAQHWAIIDVHRKYALVYDPKARSTHFAPAGPLRAPHTEDEAAFQKMWQAYFHAVTIPERANPRLHLQHVPRRYWRYLTEKQTA